MSNRMLQFTHIARRMPDKRPATVRCMDFNEVYLGFSTHEAARQASRCEQCGIPFCQIHCPLSNNIPDWLLLTASGRMQEAYTIAAATNDFPEITGRICPQDRLCESGCVLEQSKHHSVTIGAIEQYIAETAFANEWVKPLQPAIKRSQSVGIIGAGPAGLAAAGRLQALGYTVDVYDRNEQMGGLLLYGIPPFKLDKAVVERRIELLKAGGVQFHTNCAVGHDITFTELRCRHTVLVIATGLYKARPLNISGTGVKGVQLALDYLAAANRKSYGRAIQRSEDGLLNAYAKRVVVIGGGDTAMDCVRTAVRQGAVSVKCLYRRDRANMPGSQREVINAIEEGVDFTWLSAPEIILSEDSERVVGIHAIRMELGAVDASGRQEPRPLSGSSFIIPTDLVLVAIGFMPEDLQATLDTRELYVTPQGTLIVDPNTHMTSLEGVFAAGDIVRGSSLVVWAIHDGRKVAASIHTYLKNFSP